MTRRFRSASPLDIHAGQFYQGAPITVYQRALPYGRIKPQFARYWFSSQTPYRAWIIGWICRGDDPTLYLVDVSKISLSYNPVDPPPMPDWATNGQGFRWTVERAEERGLKWLKPRAGKNRNGTGRATRTAR